MMSCFMRICVLLMIMKRRWQPLHAFMNTSLVSLLTFLDSGFTILLIFKSVPYPPYALLHPVNLAKEEGTKEYGPGGYKSRVVSDILHKGRCLVIHKLGWGHFSTVWLVQDKQ